MNGCTQMESELYGTQWEKLARKGRDDSEYDMENITAIFATPGMGEAMKVFPSNHGITQS